MTQTMTSILTTDAVTQEENDYFALTDQLGISRSVAGAARENIARGRVLFLVFSGKMGSGKDTLAPLVLSAMSHTKTTHMYYANALKDEANDMFTTISKHSTPEDATVALSQWHNVPLGQGQVLVASVFDDLRETPTLTSRDRRTSVRTFLQVLGTDVRRSQDTNYWVRKCMLSAVTAAAAGESVFLTDARFPNEITFAQELGALCIRLTISEDTQVSRLLERDGHLPEAAAFTHTSETALDSFNGYNIVNDNDGAVSAAVHAITKQIADSARNM
jgi:hypothetical protein